MPDPVALPGHMAASTCPDIIAKTGPAQDGSLLSAMQDLCDAAEAGHGLAPACERPGTGWRLRRKPRLMWGDDQLESLDLAWARGPFAATVGRDPRLGPSDRAGGRRLVLTGAFPSNTVTFVTDRRHHQGRSGGPLSPTEQSPTLTGCGSFSRCCDLHEGHCRHLPRLPSRTLSGSYVAAHPPSDVGMSRAYCGADGKGRPPSGLRLTQRLNENKTET